MLKITPGKGRQGDLQPGLSTPHKTGIPLPSQTAQSYTRITPIAFDDCMPDYAQVTQALIQTATQQANLAPLRNPRCRPIMFLHPQPTPKVCLLFHGFTAAPYQFLALAQALFRAGYNVLVPLLPNHGLAGDWGPFSLPPLPTEAQTYQTFARDWLQQAQTLGQQVVVGGLAGGATLAAWLTLDQPRAIAKTLLLAPYLAESDRVIQQFTRKINRYHEWIRPREAPELPGYGGFAMPALQLFLEMGEEVVRVAQFEPLQSMFVVASASDGAIAPQNHGLLFKRVLRYQPQTWYLSFNGVPDLPHGMLPQQTDSQPEFLLTRVAKGYLESTLTWAEIAEIGYRMARGQAFSAAVEQLGLRDRISVDLPAIMAMMDKQQFLGLNPRVRRGL